jgi:hypothetical protein
MPYPIDGSNHWIGIKNEKNVVDYMNKNSQCEINNIISNGNNTIWVHKGGTKEKADAIVCFSENSKSVSIKNHSSGSFDWINTTKIPLDTNFVKKELQNFRGKYFKIPITPNIRRECGNIMTQLFLQLTSEKIKNILIQFQKTYCDWSIVNYKKKKQLFLIDKKSIFPDFIEDSQYILKGNALGSRVIWRQDKDGTEKNLNLRIRFVLNNGLGALLGLSEKNSNSSLSMKLQQDKVIQWLNKIPNKIIHGYED